MITGILVNARLGSTRLTKKHLRPVAGRAIFSYLLLRIKTEFHREIELGRARIIIATSDEPENKEFESMAEEIGAELFFGAINNIPLRHLEAARNYGLDAIISVDGDDILCSCKAMRKVYEMLQKSKPFIKTIGLPLGMNVAGYSTVFLENSLTACKDEVVETGWGRIFDVAALYEINMHCTCEVLDVLRFTLDYDLDYDFFKRIIEIMGAGIIEAEDQEIIELVVREKLFSINASIIDEYWENFHKYLDQEKGGEQLES